MTEKSQLIRQLRDLQHIKLDGLRFRFIDAKGMVSKGDAVTFSLMKPMKLEVANHQHWTLWCITQIVGRLAADIATILQGKDKPTFSPKQNMGDVVIVVNAAHVHFTHDKWDTKLYRWHTGKAHQGSMS